MMITTTDKIAMSVGWVLLGGFVGRGLRVGFGVIFGGFKVLRGMGGMVSVGLVVGVLAVSGVTLPGLAVGQDDLIIEEAEDVQQVDLGKVLSGTLTGTAAGGSNNSRSNGGVRLRYAQAFDSGFSVVLEGDAYSASVSQDFDRTSRDFSTDPPREETETVAITSNTNTTELREGYVRYSNRFFDIASGRRLLALGQFNVFSPVDFVLPFNLSSGRIELSKVSNKYQQTTNSFVGYLGPKLELQYYQFPNLERDPITKDLLEVDREYDAGVIVEDPTDGTRNMLEDDTLTAEFSLPEDEEQTIARVLFNGDRVTWGFTQYEGFEFFPRTLPGLAGGLAGVLPADFDTDTNLRGMALPDILTRASVDNVVGNARDVLRNAETVQDDLFTPENEREEAIQRARSQLNRAISQLNRRTPNPSYPEITGQGFEIAIPKGNYTWKYEVLMLDLYLDFPTCAPGPEGGEAQALDNCARYYNYLRDNYDGNAWTTYEAMLHALGFDYNSEDWTVNFAMLVFQNNPDEVLNGALELWELVSEDEHEVDSNPVFPVFHIAKHSGENNNRTTGFGFGFLGSAMGGTLYRAWKPTENWSLGLSLDLVSYRNDIALEEQEDQRADAQREENMEPSSEPTTTFAPAVRFSFQYSF